MTIARCLECAEEVRVPTGVSHEAQLRCPLCLAEYSLDELLCRLPPELIVVLEPASSAAEQSDADALAVAAIDASPDEDEQVATAPAFELDQAPVRRHRSPRTEKSIVGEMAKVLLGGVVGLAIGQLILWWLPGQWRRDPFELGKHVSRYAPLIVPAAFHHPSLGSQDAGASNFDFPSPLADVDESMDPDPLPTASDLTQSGEPGHAGNRQPPQDTPNTSPQLNGSETGNLFEGELPGDADAKPFAGSANDGSEPAEAASGSADTATLEPPRRPRWPLKPGILAASLSAAVPERLARTQQAHQAWNRAVIEGETTNRQLAAELYRSLAALGEAVTAMDSGGDAANESLNSVTNLLTEVGQDQTKLQLIDKAAPSWMVTARPHNGICLHGTLAAVVPRGHFYIALLELSSEQAVSLVSRTDPSVDLELNSDLLVLGAILDEPRHNLEGYEGEEPVVVLVGTRVGLPTTKTEASGEIED